MGFNIDWCVCFKKHWCLHRAQCWTEISIIYRSEILILQMRIVSYTLRAILLPPAQLTVFHTMSASKKWLSAAALQTEACDCPGFLNTVSPLVRTHVSSQKYCAVQDMRKMTEEFSNSPVYFLQVQESLPFLQWGDFPLLFYCRVGWIKRDSTKWQEHDLLMMKNVYRPYMVQSFFSWKFIAMSEKLIDSLDNFVSSKKYLPYTNLHDTLTIDHIPAWHNIHLLWKPITQLLLRYLKDHNATLHTGFESKANRFACYICTDTFNAESNKFCRRGG